jgi:purine nucleoside permease
LNDTAAAQAYRSKYPFSPANQPPSIIECDSGTSNVYWSGSVLGNAFSAYTKLLTNGSGTYCATQEEDNATLEALLRGHVAGKVDSSRIVLMRTASDFHRAPPGETEVFHFLYADQGGYAPSLLNLYFADREFVNGVVENWEGVYRPGLEAENYVGDLLNTLATSWEPDIGTEEIGIHS